MSTTYYLGCQKCRMAMVVGKNRFLWYEDKDTMENLREFLNIHEGHSLEYMSEHAIDGVINYDVS